MVIFAIVRTVRFNACSNIMRPRFSFMRRDKTVPGLDNVGSDAGNLEQ